MTHAIFLPGARADLLEAIRHYRERSPKLAEEFVAEVRRAARFAAEHPDASPRVRGDIRKKVLLRFRYNLLYAHQEPHVIIVAVMHHHRRPDYWHARVG